jgi:predicted TIM-barrel fold metal-dependent hydrolase
LVVVDTHAHIELPVPYVLSDTSGIDLRPEALVKSMKLYGIDKSVIMGSTTTAAISLETQEENHKVVAEASREFPELIPFALINPRSGEPGLKLAELCFGKYKMKGLKIWPWADFPINCAPVHDLAEICLRHGVPLDIHTDNLDPRAHPWLVGELAQDFPDLTIIAAHMAVDMCPDAITMAKKHDNVILEASPAPHCDALERAVKVIGDSRICWGTDWPFWDQRPALARIKSLRISDKSKERILGENIMRILKLET